MCKKKYAQAHILVLKVKQSVLHSNIQVSYLTSLTLLACYTPSNGAWRDRKISISQIAVLYPPYNVSCLFISELHFSLTHASEFSY